MERYVESLQISQLIGIERKQKRLSMYMHEIIKDEKSYFRRDRTLCIYSRMEEKQCEKDTASYCGMQDYRRTIVLVCNYGLYS